MNNIFKLRNFVILAGVAVCMAAAPASDSPMHRTDDGTWVVNSTTLCNARGFRKTTPVEAHIRNGKVVKVVALKNEETPTYFEKVKKHLLPLYDGVKLSEAKKLSDESQVDGCTGATYSTRAVQKNVKAAIEYYESNRPK